MKNFTFHNPTKVILGDNAEDNLGDVLSADGIKNVLLMYGQNSIKKNGLFDKSVSQLKVKGISYIEHGGVVPNPHLSHADEGIKKGIDGKVDAVLAIGGGSVIDEAKYVIGGIYHKCSAWDFITGKVESKGAIPLYTILTLSATATEMNEGAVLTNEKTHEKYGYGSPYHFPRVSMVNPNIATPFPEYLPYSAIDIMSHALEYYLHAEKFPLLQASLTEGLLKTVIQTVAILKKNPNDYDAKASFCWSSTMALNAMISSGFGGTFFPMHQLGHVLSGLYDTPHGLSLAITDLAYIRFAKDKLKDRLARLGREVFSVDDASGQKAIDELEKTFQLFGSKVRLSEIGLGDKMEEILKHSHLQNSKHFSEADSKAIWNLAK